MVQSGTQGDSGKFLSLFEHMADGVFYQSADGTLTEVNRAALELFGLTREEFLSRTSSDPGWYVIRGMAQRFLRMSIRQCRRSGPGSRFRASCWG